MNDEILDSNIIAWANYIIDNNTTIRGCAKNYNKAKSTIHFYLKTRLPKIDIDLFEELREVLITNFQEKHIRGGEATRRKYLEEKEVINN